MAGARIELRGQTEALAAVETALARLDDPAPMWRDMGLSLVASTQRRFETGMAPDGSPWPPSIRALFEGGKTLVKSARLMQSIAFELLPNGVMVGTNVLYAAIHQLGGVIRGLTGKLRFRLANGRFVTVDKVTIPARPFLGLDDEDGEELIAIADDWIGGPLMGGAHAAG